MVRHIESRQSYIDVAAHLGSRSLSVNDTAVSLHVRDLPQAR